ARSSGLLRCCGAPVGQGVRGLTSNSRRFIRPPHPRGRGSVFGIAAQEFGRILVKANQDRNRPSRSGDLRQGCGLSLSPPLIKVTEKDTRARWAHRHLEEIPGHADESLYGRSTL